MKTTVVFTVFSLALLSALVGADVTLDSFPEVVNVGQNYTLTWTGTSNYTYTIWLVADVEKDNEYDWTKVQGLASGLYFTSLNGSYTWSVPTNLSTDYNYALWIDGFTIPFNGASYSNITEWFLLTSTASPASSITSSATPSATQTEAPSNAASGEASNVPTNSAIPSKIPNKSLSGGAIAGIVIGCLSLLALLIVAVVVFARHKSRSGVKDREAAARANRLAPVMQENFPSYEMHGMTPQKTKGGGA